MGTERRYCRTSRVRCRLVRSHRLSINGESITPHALTFNFATQPLFFFSLVRVDAGAGAAKTSAAHQADVFSVASLNCLFDQLSDARFVEVVVAVDLDSQGILQGGQCIPEFMLEELRFFKFFKSLRVASFAR
jgi:hypothetical protein